MESGRVRILLRLRAFLRVVILEAEGDGDVANGGGVRSCLCWG